MSESESESALDGVLDDLERLTGVDHRIFDRTSLRAKLDAHLAAEQLGGLVDLRDQIAQASDGAKALERLLVALARRPSSTLFDDVSWWRTLRRRVMPLLRTYPSTKVWIPGCATGELAYSMAIVLREEGLLDRARIYATELHEPVLARARRGLLDTAAMKGAAQRYRDAGARAIFAEYHATDEEGGEAAELRPLLLDRISFLQHNLATDGSLNEFHLILARHVNGELIPSVARRAFRLYSESLCRFGILAIGPHDRVSTNDRRGDYECFEREPHLLRKERP